jgi:uncharacterized membrane protein
LAFASAIVFLSAFCSAASLTRLGTSPNYTTLAFGISAEGSAVTGVYRTHDDEVFRWTASDGRQRLGFLPGDFLSSPVAISGNGSAIAGNSLHYTLDPDPNNPDPFLDTYRGFHWTASNGMVDLGLVPGSTQTYVTAMSRDGSAVFGYSTYQNSRHSFRWTMATGILPIDDHSSATSSEITAVSANGSVAAGNMGTTPFRWTAAEGITPLGGLGYARGISADGSTIVGTCGDGITFGACRWAVGNPAPQFLSDFPAEAYLVSADGSVIAGQVRTPTEIQAFRWTAATGLVPLGFLPNGSPRQSYPTAMSDDGSLIVGVSTSADDSAFIWDGQHGMQFLKDVLIAQGAPDMDGWKLGNPTGISADGNTIVGYGIKFNQEGNGNDEGWVAVIPEPSSLLAATLIVPLLRGRRR